jgi:hypothetical protein
VAGLFSCYLVQVVHLVDLVVATNTVDSTLARSDLKGSRCESESELGARARSQKERLYAFTPRWNWGVPAIGGAVRARSRRCVGEWTIAHRSTTPSPCPRVSQEDVVGPSLLGVRVRTAG